ncbi:hypothetical protein B0H12DRAFT_1070135 [Mycena haematopus]|nr:hypothetical protein B0H12DRAFT_1070135 [Mycena haematopus]
MGQALGLRLRFPGAKRCICTDTCAEGSSTGTSRSRLALETSARTLMVRAAQQACVRARMDGDVLGCPLAKAFGEETGQRSLASLLTLATKFADVRERPNQRALGQGLKSCKATSDHLGGVLSSGQTAQMLEELLCRATTGGDEACRTKHQVLSSHQVRGILSSGQPGCRRKNCAEPLCRATLAATKLVGRNLKSSYGVQSRGISQYDAQDGERHQKSRTGKLGGFPLCGIDVKTKHTLWSQLGDNASLEERGQGGMRGSCRGAVALDWPVELFEASLSAQNPEYLRSEGGTCIAPRFRIFK